MSEWIPHDGRGRPVGSMVKVVVKTRDGYKHAACPAGYWGHGRLDESNWWHDVNPHSQDIVSYQVISEPHEDPSSQGS